MSGMATEMAARLAADGIDPSGSGDQVPMVDVPPTAAPGSPQVPEAPAPGNVGGAPVQPAVASPPAGAQNTETLTADDPGPVPYARFKEVNDRYAAVRGYEELSQYGYDPDSLGRLAAFEASYIQDPTGTITALVNELDLPQEAKASIAEALGTPSTQPPGPGAAADDENEGRAQLSPEDRELLDWAKDARAREESDARNAQLDSVVNIWKAQDKKDQLESPDDIRILTEISAAASRGGFSNLQQLAEAARGGYMSERERILGGAIQRNGRGTPPPALSEGGALPAPPQRPRTLAEANKIVQAALERGERLPDLDGRV
jgi:hypothetical protein